ncbi:MAG: hypothetical protein ACREVQ_02540 [Burkholderiales bacterium]
MFETIIGMLGIAAAALYVGFLAYKIHAIPLWIIVIGTFVLAIRQFLIDLRGSSKRPQKD